MNLLRAAALALAAAATLGLAGCGTMYYTPEGADSSLMLRGHDPVAYFVAGRATRGRADIKADHRGYIYRFASEESRRLFITSPDKYVPQFGAFSAQGMVYGIPVATDGESFKVIDGKLYLFDSARARQYFEMDQERNLELAAHYWQTEVRDAVNWQLQAFKRLLLRVPHYRSNVELEAEYEKRFGRKPG
jgi:YHS domain-containing protein